MGEIIVFKRPPSKYEDTIHLHEARNEAWKYDKVAIVGGPMSGKTYLATLLTEGDIKRVPTREQWCSDVLIDIPWEEQPQAIAARINGKSAYVVEGIAVLRALRNGMLKAPDLILLRDSPIRPLGQVQARLWMQCKRWWSEMKVALPHVKVLRVVPGEQRRV